MKKLFYFLPLLLVISSCSSSKDTVRYTVASATADCVGVAPQKCLLVKKGDATEWEFFYSQIEGFTYEEGYEYVLDVKETQLENVPADASAVKYELVKEVSKTAKTSENLPQPAPVVLGYQWGGKVLSVEQEDIGKGGAAGKMSVTVVKLEVTSAVTDKIKEGDVIYCELISTPSVIPQVDREYVFKAKDMHPAHAKGIYFLETDVMDLI